MPDFNKGSTFNKDANFQGVKFGADAPLLETELNELQDIQTEARADIIRDTIPSGFVQLGELDFDYMLNNENCVKMKTDSVAYVNGYKIKIPKDTIVDIGKAPEKDAREDLLFLEVWKEEVTKDSVLTVAGGEGQAQINNPILDDRVGQETSRRIALKWRIRHIPNFDFNISWSQANEGADKYIGLSSNGSSYPNLIPQGGKSTPTTKLSWFKVLQNRSLQPYVTKEGLLNPTSGDPGLWSNMCYKDRVEETKIELNTLDGFVYAIPMFRLYRKPSCGKAIPFEYQKINPKVDYSKFTDLMKEEKVERVVSETIGGRSLVNLAINPTSSFSFPLKLMSDGTGTGWVAKWWKAYSVIKPSTTYTIILDILDIYGSPNGFSCSGGYWSSIEVKTGSYNSIGTMRILFKSKEEVLTDGNVGFSMNNTTSVNDGVLIGGFMILEGDWTDKEIPQYFTGLKSLGEDEGNLITVRNAILNESSYDPDTGTPKLTTVEGANHITSDNLIMPNIEAQVKRGETKLSDLTSFDKIDNMVGDEVVDFTKIKGRTLQNLAPKLGNTNWKAMSSHNGVVGDDYIQLNKINGNSNSDIYTSTKTLFKPNTTYTVILEIENTNVSSISINAYNGKLFTESSINISNKNGMIKFVRTTDESFVNTNSSIQLQFYGCLSSLPEASVKIKNLTILEGDYTDTPLDQLPFVEGIKSVGENEDNKVVVKRIGKNIFNGDKYFYSTINKSGLLNGLQYTKLSKSSFKFIGTTTVDNITLHFPDISQELQEGKRYILTGNFVNFRLSKVEGGYSYLKDIVYSKDVYSSVQVYFQLPKGSINKFYNEEVDICITEYELSGDYEPYMEDKQEIILKEPLRSLPNGVCDIIEGNKVIRRIGKLVLNGSEDWIESSISTEGFSGFYISNITSLRKQNSSKICDNFVDGTFQDWNDGVLKEFIENTVTTLGIRISNSKLATQDVTGFKTWLSQNPTTVYYELATPIEEPIEPNYDKESIKTYQLDAPLRALPNGVKDEIIDGKLIRRCGEVIVDGTESDWAKEGSTGSNFISRPIYGAKSNSTGYCNRLTRQEIGAVRETNPIGFMFTADSPSRLRVKFKSTDTTVEEGKAWLKENPLKVVYELATPIEIPLKEVLPSKADFSLERQFKYSDNYLLELPNGAKDTVENGKVTRRVKKIVLNGSEDWADSSSLVLANTIGFRVIPSDKKVNTEIFCDKFKYVHHNSLTTLDEEFITGQGTTSQVYIRIAKSRLSSPDSTGFKAWLSDNPITIMYELTTPTTEELSGNNNRYCPYHKEDNTYCGSMYVGDGANDVIVENGLKNENVIIDTPFRSITNKEVVTDCKYKKSVDGYDTSYITSNGNLLDDSVYKGFKLKEAKIHFQPVRLTPGKYSLRIVFTDGTVVPNSNVCIFIFDEKKLPIMGLATNGVLYVDWEVAKKGKYLVLARNDMGISVYGEKVIQNIIVAKSETFVMDISDYSPIEKAFENTEENDIEDLRHLTSLVGFNYEQILNESFDKLLIGEL